MASDQGHGWRHALVALRYSWKGLRTAWRKEEAFRQEVLVALVAVPVALFVGETALERALLIAVVLQVLMVELLNTGIENVVDRIGPDPHKLSGRAKDVGSAAVLLAIVIAAVVWGFVLFG
ncbi:diacylglycerol kinase [Guyparkeria hydrothermalis]|uniref:diacylglycerol kinase n=1 Tax=Guyparkeria hydrothermalis TaxID=923 RepID=UPI002020EDDC|nr:diacylglycerol kinase [Guyparkeria hydrothermalis]MCL7744074.1 diacylglycerol kinase [Guyparkeria hydrothermalis]